MTTVPATLDARFRAAAAASGDLDVAFDILDDTPIGSLLVGVSDRGLRHQRNEDAFHIAVVPTDAGQVAVAIVSDGVSSAPRPDEASLMAVRTGMKLLAEGVQRGEDPTAASQAAVQAAARALTTLAGPEGAPAATYVSAVVTREHITVCWLGDSRAYWLAAGGPAAPQRQY